jgi:hypothetical protein
MKRIDNADVRYILHFPKSFAGDLAGLRVKVRDRWCLVVGSPDRYTPENTPGQWDMPVQAIGQEPRLSAVSVQRQNPDSGGWDEWLSLAAHAQPVASGEAHEAGSRRPRAHCTFTFDYQPELAAVKYDVQLIRVAHEGRFWPVISYDDPQDKHQEIKLEAEAND